MSENWAERQRYTNRLVRLAARHVFEDNSPSANQLYGLCKLTWITKSYEEDDAAYIRSTKIPALGQIFAKDYSRASLTDVAADISKTLGIESAEAAVLAHTGFTNFYPAYRNSTLSWIESHFQTLLPLFKAAYKLNTDDEGRQLIHSIGQLPGIPKSGVEGQLMRPAYFLTPAFFALDHRRRFPLINGNKGVQALLKRLKVRHASLEEQYQHMIALYGTGGINDAADLDQMGSHLPDFVSGSGKQPTKKRLEKKETQGEHELPLKDEEDVRRIQQALATSCKGEHNKLTNLLRDRLSDYTLFEGSSPDAMYDVLVNGYDGFHNLLIEAKSSVEAAHIRMAVGQLFDYWYRVNGATEPHLAILLPEKPDDTILEMLDWLDIGVLWCKDDRLVTTCTNWLERLVGE